MTTDEKFRQFVADEPAAIEELRRFAGGELSKRLDGSLESLSLLDSFVSNVTSNPQWETSSLFEGLHIRSWLAVRLAYYLGLYLRRTYGAEWYLSRDASAPVLGTPVMIVGEMEISPLEIADAYLRGTVDGGLTGVARDLGMHVGTH